MDELDFETISPPNAIRARARDDSRDVDDGRAAGALAPGGTRRVRMAISRALAADAAVHVCCLDALGAWAMQAEAAGIQVDALHRETGFHPALARRIAAIARQRHAAIIHCHHRMGTTQLLGQQQHLLLHLTQ